MQAAALGVQLEVNELSNTGQPLLGFSFIKSSFCQATVVCEGEIA